MNLVLVFDEYLLPNLRVKSELESRIQIRVFECKPNLPLVGIMARLKADDDVGWHALKLLPGEPDAPVLFIEVLLELNANLRQALLDLLKPVPLGAGRYAKAVGDI